MKVRIDKLSENKNTFESKLPLEGEAPFEPRLGYSYMIFGGDHGGLSTSSLKDIKETKDGWILTTLNSTYEVIKL